MVFTKVKYIRTLYSSNFTFGNVLNINVYIGIPKDLYENVCNCFINSQKKKAN